MSQRYFLGCPQWQHTGWSALLPPGASPLERYSKVFNSVEGNTTFYAAPSQAQCEQWRSQVPDHFRFLLKFPRHITHDRVMTGVDLDVQAFLEVIAPLNGVLGPFLLQFPAAFGPEHLDRLWHFVDALPSFFTCTVEVRNHAFFSKGDAEKALNRGLRERNISRVCFDSRALFSATPDTDIIRDAQRKKPCVPIHLLPVDAPPVIRYIGHPDIEANRRFLTPWVERVGTWIEKGRRPFVFMHMPDNSNGLALAALWTELLNERISDVDVLSFSEDRPQIGLF